MRISVEDPVVHISHGTTTAYKKLMRMAAEEAFRLHRIVVIGLAVTTAAAPTGILCSIKFLFS